MPDLVTYPLEYYAHQGLMTDPGEHTGLFDDLPTETPALCQVVQGLLLHIFWAERYGVTLSEGRKREVEIRPVSQMLARIREMDHRPLTVARPLEKRLGGNCRDFNFQPRKDGKAKAYQVRQLLAIIKRYGLEPR